MRKLWLLLPLLIAGLLAGCNGTAPEQSALPTLPVPTSPAIPPTFTPIPAASRINAIPVVTVTQQPLPTTETRTPVPFGANVVELRLTIPSVEFDRRLQGSVNSQIILVDESNGFSVQRDNQASVLLDLQQVLPKLVLEPVPDGCEGCVQLTYNLPFSGVVGEGWLRDSVLLASLENYFTTVLGPHFPAGAMIGLRRSASPYAPAHSMAVMEDGRLLRWLATDSEVGPVSQASPALLDAFEALDSQALAQQYAAPCPGSPLESLLLADRETERLIALVCPEFALSAELQPLYVALNDALAELLANSEATIARPPAGFPLTAVLDYQRVDEAQLTIFMDGTVVASSSATQPISTTLSSSQVISLTTELLASGALRTGLTTFLADDVANGTSTPAAPRSVVLLRGPDAVYDAQWFNTSDLPLLADLNRLLNELLLSVTAGPTATPEGGSGDPAPTGEPPSESTPTIEAAATTSPTATPADE